MMNPRGLILILALAPFAWLTAVDLSSRLQAAADRAQQIGASTLPERTRDGLVGPSANGVQGGLYDVQDAALLIEPARKDCGLLELQFGFVAKGDLRTARASNLLLHELAPEGWVFILPWERMDAWIKESKPGALSPTMVGIVKDTEIYLFHGFSAEELAAVRQRFAALFGFEIFIHCESRGDSHLLMLKSLEGRIRAGDADAQRFRSLLPS